MVSFDFGNRSKAKSSSTAGALTVTRSFEQREAETLSLLQASELKCVGQNTYKLSQIRAATMLGTGQIDELSDQVKSSEAELVVFDAELSPIQQRNLERSLEVKVIDRVGLIIEIFGLRAQTKEGRLQVDLAALTYQRSRLVRAWTNLDRQRGGRGFTGGPGETRLELDRRQIDQQIVRLKRELDQVRKTRRTHRSARAKVPLPIVVLVGYTNAGKSSLFNALTKAQVEAKDMVFATLDPRLKRLQLPSGKACLLADTVGFISDLPTELIEAFHATLEEVEKASLILHVRDIACSDTGAQKQDVEQTLERLLTPRTDEQPAKDVPDLDPDPWPPYAEFESTSPQAIGQTPIIEVGNKADLLTDEQSLGLNHMTLVSAASGKGLKQLSQVIDQHFSANDFQFSVTCQQHDGATQAMLHSLAKVTDTLIQDDGTVELICAASEDKFGKIDQIISKSVNAQLRLGLA